MEGLNFLNGLLQDSPEDRMSWDELVAHPYLNFSDDKLQDPVEQLMMTYNEVSGTYRQEQLELAKKG